MNFLRLLRIATFAVTGLLLLVKVVGAQELGDLPGSSGTIPPLPPVVQNYDFECTTGYVAQTDATGKEIFVPAGWQLTTLAGAPLIHSARTYFAKSCDGSAHVERISGIDSIVIRAEDLETPPEPGKPFDVAFHQQISATVGGAYSLSGWMLSLCGGSAVPSDCPADFYIAKMLGIDPTGGTDPNGATVLWTENRHNFWENGQKVGWQQMSVSALAQSSTITIFARIQSPQRWHGNHAFIDALSLVRAPLATLQAPAAVTGTVALLSWQGQMLSEITSQSGSTHQLLFDIEGRHERAQEWRALATGQSTTQSLIFQAACTNTSYRFRVRAPIQPEEIEGAWPNHRYVGLWSDPVTIHFNASAQSRCHGAPHR
ncbi:MAG: hypothetical protein R2867_16505 [Caldilineaceae bacterium]